MKTRVEQIKEAMKNHPRLNDISDIDDRLLYYCAFVDGAQWSDSNPAARGALTDSVCDHGSVNELERANKRIAVLTEALESIAFNDEPAADTIDYWQKIIDEKDNKIAETLANDTTIARDALKEK